MNLLKYGIYLAVIVVIALIFEKVMTLFYDLTVRSATGDLRTFVILACIWLGIFLLAKVALNRKVHPKTSTYAMAGGLTHLGGCLAAYFMETNPLLLLIFPAIFLLAYTQRHRTPSGGRGFLKLQPTHPLFVDGRGGACVFRHGAQGFKVLKFLGITPPIPVRELLLYLFHEQIEWTLEIQSQGASAYVLTLITHGRNYDAVHKQCLEQASHLRHFFDQEGIAYEDFDHVLDLLPRYYAPYFIYIPTAVDERGVPEEFPRLTNDEEDLLIEFALEERIFSLHNLQVPLKEGTLCQFLDRIDDSHYVQIHMRPLAPLEIAARAEELNREYRASIQRLTNGLEANTEFQAASYLFTQVGETQKKALEPLLDKGELAHLRAVKRRIQQTELATETGLWEAEITLLGNPVLAQNLANKTGGRQQRLAPQYFTQLASREWLGRSAIVDSMDLFRALQDPAQESQPPAKEQIASRAVVQGGTQ